MELLLTIADQGAAEVLVFLPQDFCKIGWHLDSSSLVVVEIHNINTLIIVCNHMNKIQLILRFHQLPCLIQQNPLLFL